MNAAIPTLAVASDLADLLAAGYGIGPASAEGFEQVRDFLAREALNLRAIEPFAGSLVLARCNFTPPPRRFRIDPDGELAVVIEAIEVEDGERWIVDLVAWPIDRPAEFAAAIGHAHLLGRDQISNPANFFAGQPLLVHRPPSPG